MPPDKSLVADHLILVGPRRPGFDHWPSARAWGHNSSAGTA